LLLKNGPDFGDGLINCPKTPASFCTGQSSYSFWQFTQHSVDRIDPVCLSKQEKTMSDICKKIFAIALISFIGFGIAACETANGFGRDVEDAGEAIQKGTD
tara:strand:+ start:3026 stop:3328 length:303 start_codon:yes stop_codon:yes gene_type:complete